MKNVLVAVALCLSGMAAAQTQVKCQDYTRAGMRQGTITSTENSVSFYLTGIELWGGDDQVSAIDFVTTDDKNITVFSNEPGANFFVEFPRSQCQFDNRSTICTGLGRPVNFSYWPIRANPRYESRLTLDSKFTTVAFASGRLSLIMTMPRPNGTTSIQNISFSCME